MSRTRYHGGAMRRQRTAPRLQRWQSSVTVCWTHPETDEAYQVECTVSAFVPARLGLPPEHCSPAEGGEVEIVAVRSDPGGEECPKVQAAIEAYPRWLAMVQEAAGEAANAPDDDERCCDDRDDDRCDDVCPQYYDGGR